MLALDTSTASMTVAIVDGGAVLAEEKVRAERDHSVRLLPEVGELMQACGLRPRDLHAVCVGRGPGSYTGVRIGVTAAKTIAWALGGIPLYAVSSLEALALGGWRDAVAAGVVSRGASAWVVPVLDGRRGQAYTALFEADPAEAGLRRLVADAVVPFREQVELWMEAKGRPGSVVFVGEVGDDGSFAEMLDQTAAEAAADGVAVLRRPWAMAAQDVAAAARLHAAEALVQDAHDLLPNYTQLAEAEAKLVGAAAPAAKTVPVSRLDSAADIGPRDQ